jgi:hypothetical protein
LISISLLDIPSLSSSELFFGIFHSFIQIMCPYHLIQLFIHLPRCLNLDYLYLFIFIFVYPTSFGFSFILLNLIYATFNLLVTALVHVQCIDLYKNYLLHSSLINFITNVKSDTALNWQKSSYRNFLGKVLWK